MRISWGALLVFTLVCACEDEAASEPLTGDAGRDGRAADADRADGPESRRDADAAPPRHDADADADAAHDDAALDADPPESDATPDADPPSPPRIPECPGAMESCEGMTCAAGQICLEINLSCGPAGGQSAECVDDPCDGSALDCMGCAGDYCRAIGAMGTFSCSGSLEPDVLRCSGGGICASPDTRIATPRGEVAIAELRAGDLVYSRDDDGVVVVPLIAATRRAVAHHSVIHLVLDDGTSLEISGPHPLADGRTLEGLAIGDAIEGRRVVATEYVDYLHAHTYDVLPASCSRAYVANGVWMGSTLAP